MAVIAKRRSQEERRAESERRIIDSAIALYSSKGYHKTSLVEIGTAAGYTGALVSQRFGSKQGLLQAVLKYIVNSFAEERLQDCSSQSTSKEALHRYITLYLDEILHRRGRLRPLYILMGEALGGTPEALSQIVEYDEILRSWLANVIERGRTSGEFRDDIDVGAVAVVIVAIVRGASMQALVKPEAVEVVSVTAMVLTMIDALLTRAAT